MVETADSPELLPPAGHYSHVALHERVAYISGQLPLTAQGVPLADQSFSVQVKQVLENLEACLRTAGSDRTQLISVTVYVTDIGNWPEFERLYAAWLGDARPARAVAGVHELHYGAALEVLAVAARN